jgi:hypothetical protein
VKISELHNQLQLLNIPEDWYYLHGLYGSTDDNDKIALVIKQDNYEVYFKERGQKTSERYFDKESEACEYMLKQLKTELIFHKAQSVENIGGMTVNEKLFVSGLFDDFDAALKQDKGQAKLILRLLKVDENQIDAIVK